MGEYLAAGDSGGNFYILELFGFEKGPIIVTPLRIMTGLCFRCPACQNHFQITEDKLGSEMTCLTEGCNLRLKVNPFVIHTN